MSAREIKSMRIKGSADCMILTTGFSKRMLEMKRFIPTGGVEAPICRLVRKMIPRWIGWIP